MQFELTSENYVSRLISIRGFPGMDMVSSSALSLFAERTHECRFRAGDTIYKEGAQVDTIYLILEGEIELKRHGALLRTLGPREVCDAISVFAGSNGPLAVAKTDVAALEMDAGDTEEIFLENFDMMALGLLTSAAVSLATVPSTVPRRFEGKDLPDSPLQRLEYLSRALPFAADRTDALAELSEYCELITATSKDSTFALNGALWIPLTSGWSSQSLHAPGEALGLREALAQVAYPQAISGAPGQRALRLETDLLLDWLEDYSQIAWKLLRQLSIEIIASQSKDSSNT